MSAFSERIKEIRESLSMNKSQFAIFLDTNIANISRYEHADMGYQKMVGEPHALDMFGARL